MADISNSVCLNHPDTPAVARCATCGKPVCAKCLVSKNGSGYCSKKCAADAETMGGRADSVLAERKKTNSKGTIRAIIILIILIAVAAAGYYFYQQNKDDVNRFVRKTEKSVSKSAGSVKDSIQSGIPTDSKYKRDREGLVK